MTTAPTSAPPQPMTAEEFERMPGNEFYELVDGYLKERNVSLEANWIATRLGGALLRYEAVVGGVTFGEGFELAIDSTRPGSLIYKPDGAFVCHGRIPGDRPRGSRLTIAPDLVIEVASPANGAGELVAKALDYLRFGVRMVWLVYPDSKLVNVLTRGSNLTEMVRPGTPLTGGDVLPALNIDLDEVFPVDEEVAEQQANE